jgi:hypothetical protein
MRKRKVGVMIVPSSSTATAGISNSADLVLMIVAASHHRGIRQLVWASV